MPVSIGYSGKRGLLCNRFREHDRYVPSKSKTGYGWKPYPVAESKVFKPRVGCAITQM